MPDQINLQQKIEAVLYAKGEPVSKTWLQNFLSVTDKELADGILELKNNLADRGIIAIESDGKIMLGTRKEASSIIEEMAKEEIGGELGKAAMETLAVILYKNKINRREIEYIRGVNCQFSLRNLVMRGLVEREHGTEGERGYYYRPSIECLAYLGVSSVLDLPNYAEVSESIKKFETSRGTGVEIE